MLVLSLGEHKMPVVDKMRVHPLSGLFHFDLDYHVWCIHLALPLYWSIIEAPATYGKGLRSWEQRKELVCGVSDDQ